MKSYHLTKNGEDWRLLWEWNSRSTVKFDGLTKVEAEKQAAEYLKSHDGWSLKIHGVNGKIQEERTYPRSADPSSSEG